MGSNKGLKGVIMCVLILGLVLKQVQVDGKSCCSTNNARNCFNACRYRGVTSKSVCASVSGCVIVSDKQCPGGYPKLDSHSDSDFDTPDAVEFCNIGCRSSICDNMNNVYDAEGKKPDVKLCANACASFCNRIAVTASVAA